MTYYHVVSSANRSTLLFISCGPTPSHTIESSVKQDACGPIASQWPHELPIAPSSFSLYYAAGHSTFYVLVVIASCQAHTITFNFNKGTGSGSPSSMLTSPLYSHIISKFTGASFVQYQTASLAGAVASMTGRLGCQFTTGSCLYQYSIEAFILPIAPGSNKSKRWRLRVGALIGRCSVMPPSMAPVTNRNTVHPSEFLRSIRKYSA